MFKSSLSSSLVHGIRNKSWNINNNNNNILLCRNVVGAVVSLGGQKKRDITTLILLRHGQSIWNGGDARFTGWSDVPLTVKGRVEAVAAGQLLRSRGFTAERVDVAFTSNLQRAHETCELALASMAGSDQHTWSTDRIRKDWRLNERHYGAIQGRYKNDQTLTEQYGMETLVEWRRSMTARPPPIEDLSTLPENEPPTESLQDCQERILKCWYDTILPCMYEEEGLSAQKGHRTVLVVAHSNTLRSLMAALDDVPEHLVPNLHVPNSVPILYTFCPNSRGELVTERLESAAGGSHARWLVSSCNHAAVRRAIKPGGMLTRSLFDAMDLDGDGKLTAQEIESGIHELLKEERISSSTKIDCAVINVAKKIAVEMKPHSTITLRQFEKSAERAVMGLQNPSQSNYFEDVEPEPFP